jgi:hypothetical protein
MNTPRVRHTATLLPDGRVLVVGGLAFVNGRVITLNSAEIYDPQTNSWTQTPAMTFARSRHIAALLPNGKVLIAGGRTQPAPTLAAAELYDPQTNMWTLTGSMSEPRDNFAAVRLQDGRVLVSGGGSGGPNGPFLQKTAEIYDFGTGTWSTVHHMANARFGHRLTLLNDGRVLVTGGANSGGHCVYQPTAEIFDPQSGDWSNVRPMLDPRGFHLATRLRDGRVLVAGGWTMPACETACATAEIFDPDTEEWQFTPAMTSPRGALVLHSADALLDNGKVLASGGILSSGFEIATAELYDPELDEWVATASMSIPRSSHTSTLLKDGRMLVAGGDNGIVILSSAEIYTP